MKGGDAAMGAQVCGERLEVAASEDRSSSRRIRVRIGEEHHVLLSLGAGGLIQCHPSHLIEVGRIHCLVRVLLAQRYDPVERKSTDAGGARYGRLPRQRRHERLTQQREPAIPRMAPGKSLGQTRFVGLQAFTSAWWATARRPLFRTGRILPKYTRNSAGPAEHGLQGSGSEHDRTSVPTSRFLLRVRED